MSNWTFIRVCPKTGVELSWRQTDHSGGVCPACGHISTGTFTHYTKVVGKWTKREVEAVSVEASTLLSQFRAKPLASDE